MWLGLCAFRIDCQHNQWKISSFVLLDRLLSKSLTQYSLIIKYYSKFFSDTEKIDFE